MSKTTKAVTAIITVMVIIGAVVGGLMWNKPSRDVENTTAVKINAVDLYNNFLKDTVAAKTKYINKVVEVTGEVKEVSTNQQNQLTILLRTNLPDAFVNCTIEGKTADIKPGSTIVIKGICNGLSGDADMGIPIDVVLDRCYILN